jgi:hypothetical protein
VFRAYILKPVKLLIAVLIGTATGLLSEAHPTARCLSAVSPRHQTLLLECATGFHCSMARLAFQAYETDPKEK